MKKISILTFIIFIGMFFYQVFCFGEIQEGNQKARDFLYSEIRRNFEEFREYVEFKSSIVGEVAEPFINAEKYAKFYSDNFTIHEVVPNEFGGIFVTITLKDPQQLFWLWIYAVDKNVWDLRMIEKM